MCEIIQLEPGRIVNKWKIEKKLGEGAFGAVFKCSYEGKMYALKTEGQQEKIQLLKMEVFVLLELAKSNGTRHFCKIEDKGQCDNFNYVVMTLVGKSLQDLLLIQRKRRFSMGTALSIGIQCLEALEDLHSIGYLHRDVKPGNYTIGRPDLKELRKVYVLDFGMARKFVHDDGTMKKPRSAAGFRGTVRYAALSCHVQREMCRKDDIESWLYMVVELTRGKLPWRHIEDQDEVGVMKKQCRKEQAVKHLFGGCPRQFVDIMRLSDSWKFFDAPDYEKIYALMKEAIVSTKAEEFPYDWEPEAIKKADEVAKAKKAAGKNESSSSNSEKESKMKKIASKEKVKQSDKEKEKRPSKESVKKEDNNNNTNKKDESTKKKKKDDGRVSPAANPPPPQASEKQKPNIQASEKQKAIPQTSEKQKPNIQASEKQKAIPQASEKQQKPVPQASEKKKQPKGGAASGIHPPSPIAVNASEKNKLRRITK